MKTLSTNTKSFFSCAVGVAEHYGFKNIDDICTTTPKKRKTRELNLHQCKSSEENYDQHILSNVLKGYAEETELQKQQPLLFYTPSLVSKPRVPSSRMTAITLSAVGAHDPLVEIVVVKGAVSILEELELKNYVVRVNSLGDSDSSTRFVREVTPLLRQRAHDLPQKLVEMLRDDAGKVLAKLYEARHPVVADLPSPLEFLTTPSRKHFKDLLELMDQSGIPFELDERLYGDHSIYSHSIFEIVEKPQNEGEKVEVLSRGGRYDALTKNYVQNAVPAIGMVLAFNTKESTGQLRRPSRKRPSACLVHIGREARIKSLSIIETFRREKIPIEQCLQFERFSDQVAYAQQKNTKYIVIMGQREAQEDVVIVRNALDRSQKTVPINTLPQYLRVIA